MVPPEAILSRIEARRDALVELTAELVRIPTVNPPGTLYTECAEFLGRRLAACGFTVSYVRAEGAPGDSDHHPRMNVVGRREGRRPGPCVHLTGHLDVVLPGDGWTVDPFAGEVRDGRVWGRGTCDMKGGIAAALVAMEALLEAAPDLPGTVEVSGTADEESGGYGGVAYLASRGFFSRPRVDHVIIPEPFDPGRIGIGHRGVWWAEIETSGHVAHGSMPFLGDCAVRHMGALLARLERDLFPRLAERRTAMPVVPEAARCSTLNVAGIHGGHDARSGDLPSPIVPDRCRLLLDRRFPVEETLEGVKAEMMALLDGLARERPGFRYAVRDVLEVLPTMTPHDAPVVTALSRQIARVLGREAELVCSPGSFDLKHVVRIGGLDACVAYGPGRLELAHQPDEWVAIDDLVASAKVMALATADLLGALQ